MEWLEEHLRKRVVVDLDESMFAAHCTIGDLKAVKYLLRRTNVDPSADDNEAIKGAWRMKHTQIVKLLLRDERVLSSLSKHEKNIYMVSTFM